MSRPPPCRVCCVRPAPCAQSASTQSRINPCNGQDNRGKNIVSASQLTRGRGGCGIFLYHIQRALSQKSRDYRVWTAAMTRLLFGDCTHTCVFWHILRSGVVCCCDASAASVAAGPRPGEGLPMFFAWMMCKITIDTVAPSLCVLVHRK